MTTLERILASDVFLHRQRTVTWGIDSRLAQLLHELGPGATTLETGAGRSTLVLLNAGVRRHFAIQPNPEEVEAIREAARALEIATTALVPVVARSQDYLPGASLPDLDVVLIDGAHAFPVPFLDWYFTVHALKIGGTLIIDDINIATGTILADFLASDPSWVEVVRDRDALRFAAYRKIAVEVDPGTKDWLVQPYLRDAYPTRAVQLKKRSPKGLVERAAGYLPWRVQHALRGRFEWPRPRWVP